MVLVLKSPSYPSPMVSFGPVVKLARPHCATRHPTPQAEHGEETPHLCKQIYHFFPWPPRRLFVRRLIVYHRKMLKSGARIERLKWTDYCDQNWEPDSRNLYMYACKIVTYCNYAYIYTVFLFAYIVILSYIYIFTYIFNF